MFFNDFTKRITLITKGEGEVFDYKVDDSDPSERYYGFRFPQMKGQSIAAQDVDMLWKLLGDEIRNNPGKYPINWKTRYNGLDAGWIESR